MAYTIAAWLEAAAWPATSAWRAYNAEKGSEGSWKAGLVNGYTNIGDIPPPDLVERGGISEARGIYSTRGGPRNGNLSPSGQRRKDRGDERPQEGSNMKPSPILDLHLLAH